MNYLAIDTSGKSLIVIIKNGDKVLSFYDDKCAFRHSVELMPKVEQLAKEADFDFSKADFFACVVGAGSFTGIRIGVSTIKAMCFAFNKPCLSVTSFDTLAYNKRGKVMAIIDAKHNGFYACGYENNKVCFAPTYIMRDELEKIAKDYTLVSFEKVSGFDVEVVSVVEGFIKAIEEKKGETTADLNKLEPLYCRKSQAEEGR